MTQPVAPPPAAAPVGEQWVDAVNPEGKAVQIPAAMAQDAAAKGYTLPGADDAAKQSVYDTAVAKGFSPTVATGIAAASPFLSWQQGAVEGATAGLGSGLQRKIAGVVGPIAARALGGPEMSAKEAEDYYKDIAQGGAHGGIHGVGQVAGLVGGSLAAGPLAGAARGGAAIGRGLGLLSAAGRGAQAGARAVTAGIASRGALGRAVATGAEYAAQGAVETGLYSGVHELSEEMFGDPKLSAEKILSAASDGAYGGAMIGGALGAGGSLAVSGARGVKNYASGVLSRNADALQTMANEQRWRALVPRQKFTQQAEARLAGGAAGGGEALGRYGIGGTKLVDAMKRGDVSSMLPELDEALTSVGQKIGTARGASTATVKWGDIDDAIEKVAAPLRKSALLEDKLAAVNKIRGQISSDFLATNEAAQAVARGEMDMATAVKAMREQEIPLQQVVERRQILDDLFYEETKALDPSMRVQLMRDMRGHLEETIMTSFDDAAKSLGDKFARANLEQLKHDYQALSLARSAAKISAPAAMSNRMISLTDYVAGAAMGGGLTGTAAALGNKFLRQRGNMMAASVLDSLAAAGGKPRALVGAAEAAEEAIAPGLAAPTAEAVAPVAAGPGAELLERRAALGRELGEIPPAPSMTPRPGEPAMPARPADFDEAFPEPRDIGPAPPTFDKPKPEVKAAAGGQPSREEFESRLTDAIHHLDKRDKHGGLVPFSEIRKEFPELSREEFDRLATEVHGKSRNISLKVNDDPFHMDVGGIKRATGVAEGSVIVQRPASGSENLKQHLSWAVAHEPPSGKPWQRAASEGDDALAAWEAEKAASEQAHKEYAAAKKAASGEHESAVNAWEGRSNQWVDAEDAYDASIKAAKEQHASELQRWESAHAAEESAAADRAAQFERVQAAIDHVDGEIEKAAKGMVTGAPKPGSASSEPSFKSASPYRPGLEAHKSLRTQFDQARNVVARMSEDLANNVKPTGLPDMPMVSEQMAVQGARTVAYLSNQVPQPLGQPILGEPVPHAVTDSDMHSFLEKFRAATNPPSALRQFARGVATPEQIDAIRFVTPEIFSSLQVKTLEQLRASKDVPFERRQQMALLLGIDTDPSQDPAFASALRAGSKVQGMGPSGGMGPTPTKGKAAKIPTSLGLGRYDRLRAR